MAWISSAYSDRLLVQEIIASCFNRGMPNFKHHIFVCGNQRVPGHPRGCCDPEGQETLRAAFKKQIKSRSLRASTRANRAGCLDQCEHGPCLVIYPEGVWYGSVQVEDVDEILEEHVMGGRIVERLQLAKECINNPHCPHRKETGVRMAEWKRTEV